jgi:phospholipase C
VVSLSDLATDLAGNTPRFSWITPDRCHDTHDCRVAVGDQWLQETVGAITASSARKNNGILVITWDEDDGSASNRVPLIALGASVQAGGSDRQYDHYSLLATVEDMLGVSRLGAAASAITLSDLVTLPKLA